MTINGNYSHPVTVNGFSCNNCAEVDQAKKGIDPANPSAGPGGAKHAEKARFLAEARDTERLAREHAAQATVSPIAAAYGAPGAAPGSLVSVPA